MTDLFSHRPMARPYPALPGHKGGETSLAAAESMEPSAPLLRSRCLERLKQGPATPDEVADALRLSVLSVRPRFTELARAGEIADTGVRRRNASGRAARVWRAA